MEFTFYIDGYSLRDVLSKNVLQLIALDLKAIAKNSVESINNECRKNKPNLLRIIEWESELSFVYKSCLGLFENFMSFSSSAGRVAKFISDEGKIMNRDELFAEINILIEKFLVDENVV